MLSDLLTLTQLISDKNGIWIQAMWIHYYTNILMIKVWMTEFLLNSVIQMDLLRE